MLYFIFIFCINSLTSSESLLNAVKCNLTELTTKSISILYWSGVFLRMRMCRNSIYSLFEAFLCVPWVWTCSDVRGGVSSLSRQFSPPLPSLFPLFIQCDGCLFPFLVWGLMAGLPGFASHGRSLQVCRLVMIYCAHNWFFRRVHFIIPASKQTKDKTRRG